MGYLTSRLALIALAGLAGCAAKEPVPPAEQAVTVDFALVAGAQPVKCGQPFGPLGRDRKRLSLHDARFYLQDVALIDAAGQRVPLRLDINDWQDAQVALLDFEDGSGHCAGGTPGTHTQVSGHVPPGHYRGLSLTLGVPEALNHTSTELQGAPLDLAAMGWSWQAGRKFIKVEVDPVGGVTKVDGARANTWYLHLGATGCNGNPVTGETVACQRANRIPLTLPDFDPARQQVALDLAALFQDSTLGEHRGAAVGCMSGPSDPECVTLFPRLGLDLNSGQPVQPGHSPVFAARAKP
ncbi:MULTISPECIES: MbnP family copper-binding protein [Pseudomonas chlororaphis group]|uniref:MbnP family copper-binding protein n=1 Tax=Pseudomonas chlororaphis group TaxID=136842 RepID=UPI002097A969|nr:MULTISPECIES: MbnP family copper-binding protein [Pseudomonas chlororaphis group]MCO7577549.1 metallo-mystery pair system four-Cys motif protein [Pseudomonas protegens]MCO7583735.1 metallo-mystery pair system four-Cys motif protein [Pseudomonas chlororaphis]MCO7600932.1 metallo-mystery pair system four-Cys motif protein [Pseudomonas chlororaphis]